MKSKLTLALTAAMFVMAAAALAQSDRGAITGAVTDPQGASVLGASITLLNVETGSRFATQANETGNYSITSVPVGTYALQVEHAGFRKFSQTGIHVGVAQTVRLDVSLLVGATSEAVTVYGDASLLKTESAEQSTVITADKINELPLKFYADKQVRNLFSFASLSPGVTGSTTWDIQVNGVPIYNFRIVLEGQDTGSSLGPGSFQDLQPSLDAIGEFTLQSGTFAAEYGQVGAGSAQYDRTVRRQSSARIYLRNHGERGIQRRDAFHPSTSDVAPARLRGKRRRSHLDSETL